MSNTTLLLLSVFVFSLLIAGLYFMVREFMGEVQDAFPDVNEWLDSDKKKKKWWMLNDYWTAPKLEQFLNHLFHLACAICRGKPCDGLTIFAHDKFSEVPLNTSGS